MGFTTIPIDMGFMGEEEVMALVMVRDIDIGDIDGNLLKEFEVIFSGSTE